METQLDVASTTAQFIDSVVSLVNDNIALVLVFAAGILVWFVFKKWIFGGTRRI